MLLPEDNVNENSRETQPSTGQDRHSLAEFNLLYYK